MKNGSKAGQSFDGRRHRQLLGCPFTQLFGDLLAFVYHCHRPNPQHQPASKLETAYHRADKAIQQIVDLLAA